jgi:universal stress protein E
LEASGAGIQDEQTTTITKKWMQRFQNILFFVHFNRSSERAVSRVCWLAEHTGAFVTVFGIDPLFGTQTRGLMSSLHSSHDESAQGYANSSCQDQLDVITQNLIDYGINVRAIIGHGPEVQEIQQQIQIGKHDLCIKTMDHAHLGGLWPSTDLQLLRQCPVALWLLHPNQTERLQRLLAVVDLDIDDHKSAALNNHILGMSTSLAELDSAILDVLHPWWLPEESALGHSFIKQLKVEVDAAVQQTKHQTHRQLNRLVEQYAHSKIDIHSVLESGIPEDAIPRYAKTRGVDTLIMGTEGRAGFTNLLIGNTAAIILKLLDCSLLVVRPPQLPTDEVTH